MKGIDQINRKILELLQVNGKMTNAEIAERTGLSPASTLERVKKLERQGIIDRYVALVDGTKLDRGTVAFVAISLAVHGTEAISRFQKAIHDLPEVMECYHIAGDDDYLLKVVVRDIAAYEAFILEQLTGIENIGKIRTNFVMSTVKHETAIRF